MADITEQQVREALEGVLKPEQIDNVAACGADVKVEVILSSTADPNRDAILNSTREALQKLPGVENINVGISLKTPPAKGFGAKPQAAGPQETAPVSPKQVNPAIKNIIAVSSGKGGVGKTSVAVNLACALKQKGYAVGILDADIYGPNVPIMMGLRGAKLASTESGKLGLPENEGIRVVSMAFLLKEEQPVVWRGPMLDKVIRQFHTDAEWGELDYLIVDLPPGTGDAQLTVMQAMPVSGAIIVTTPQEVAIHDSKKGLAMFVNAHIPVLGIVENMSYFRADDGKEYEIFGRGGGRKAAGVLDVPFLGELPIIPGQREQADIGRPIVLAEPESEQAQRFAQLADQVLAQLEVAETRQPAGTAP